VRPTEAHGGGAAGQDAVGDARQRVGLVQQRRDAGELRRGDHREAGVAADTDHQIGAEPGEDAARLQRRDRQLERQRQVARQRRGSTAAIEAADPGGGDAQAGGARGVDLGAAAGAGEEQLDGGMDAAELLGDGQHAVHVARGVAAGDGDAPRRAMRRGGRRASGREHRVHCTHG
jgi:hypothetical protein